MKRAALIVLIPAIVAGSGCSTTKYLGPLDVVSPASPPYPASVPRVVAVPPGPNAMIAYPGGTPWAIPKDSQYVREEISYGLGALEGGLGGALIGLAAGATSTPACSSDGCAAGALIGSALLGAALGALYGVVVGHKTTYVLGPNKPY
jgi:hypothetical protein